MTDRERLAGLLEQLLDETEVAMQDSASGVDESELTANAAIAEKSKDRKVLHRAIWGLKMLDYGQVDRIFAPKPAGKYGAQPGTAAEIRAATVGLLDVLKGMGEKVGVSEKEIADSMGNTVESLQKWKLSLKKTNDQHLNDIRDSMMLRYTSATETLKRSISKESILEHASLLGKQYQAAMSSD